MIFSGAAIFKWLLPNAKYIVIGVIALWAYKKGNGWLDDLTEERNDAATKITQLVADRNNARIEAETAKATVSEMKKNEIRLELLLDDALKRQDMIRKEAREQVEVFEKHDLQKLVDAKPGLIEKLANKATKERMDEFEDAFNN